jgi:hypothetical protein
MDCRVHAGPGNTIEATAECLDRSNTPGPVHLFTFQKAEGDSLQVGDNTVARHVVSGNGNNSAALSGLFSALWNCDAGRFST